MNTQYHKSVLKWFGLWVSDPYKFWFIVSRHVMNLPDALSEAVDAIFALADD